MTDVFDTELYRLSKATREEIRSYPEEKWSLMMAKIFVSLEKCLADTERYLDLMYSLEDGGYATTVDVSALKSALSKVDSVIQDEKMHYGLNQFDTRHFPDVAPIACRFGSGLAIDMDKELALADGKLDAYTEQEWKDYLGAAYERYFGKK